MAHGAVSQAQSGVKCCRSLSTAEQETLAHQLLKQHRHQNTYTLAKAAAEKLIDEQRANIPCCVVRPTIVSASYREPVPVCMFRSYISTGLCLL